MFGGAGLYHDGLMFALVANEQIYLKADSQTKPSFQEAGCRPFVFDGKGGQVETSYWSIPEAALDDSELLKTWTDLAYASALRARKTGRGKAARRSPD